MKTFAISFVLVCAVFVGFGQAKNYKNQINRTLTEKINLQNPVEEREIKPSTQTPKYQQKPSNVEWVDTVKKKNQPPSYKQHGGRPN
jgi:methyl coenzyme M reductase gamma subunit